jgi:tryptophan synthase alpha chain
VEIGIPFSDPVADGPVIAGAMHEALERGATVRGVLAEVAEARAETDAALIAMVSVSIVHRFGVERFVAECAAAGFDGFIFPDLALEEAGEAAAVVRAAGRSLSMLIAPATPPERAAALAAASSGFCYLLARAGVTGSGAGAVGSTTGPAGKAAAPAGKTAAPAGAGLAERLRGLRRVTDLPIACGFGISTPQQVAAVTAEADAAIVGSAIVGAMRRAAEAGDDAAKAAAQLTGSLLAAAK